VGSTKKEAIIGCQALRDVMSEIPEKI